MTPTTAAFPEMSRYVSSDRLIQVSGIKPENSLPARSIERNFVSRAIESGSTPENLLLFKLRTSSAERADKRAGSSPESRFPPSSITLSFVSTL